MPRPFRSRFLLSGSLGLLVAAVAVLPFGAARPEDTQKFGVALTFANAYDAKKLAAGFAGLLPKSAKVKVIEASATVAIVLVGLGEEYAKPQPADANDHLTPALKAAAGGTHV